MYESVSKTSYTNVTYYPVEPQPNYGPYPLQPDPFTNYGPGPGPVPYPSSNYYPISPAVQPLTKEAAASASHGTFINNNLFGKIPKVFKKKQKKPKVSSMQGSVNQSVWCNLCKIKCNSVQHYEKHLNGKNHNKLIRKMYVSTISSVGQSSHLGNNASETGVPVDLEAKKQKLIECGVAVQSVRVCTICDVACNGEIVYADHIVGKKHIAKERSMTTRTNPSTTSVSNLGTNSQNTTVVGSASCEVCKISCTSSEGLVSHRQGKRHKKNLDNLRKSISDVAPSVGPVSGPIAVTDNAEATQGTVLEPEQVKNKGALSVEPTDLETKKRKILECGADVGASNKSSKFPALFPEPTLQKAKEQALDTKTNASTTSVSNPGTNSQNTPAVGPTFCDICKISCTSSVALVIHCLGKRHKKNSENLRNSRPDLAYSVGPTCGPSSVPDSAEVVPGTVSEAEQAKKVGAGSVGPTDLKTKKKKMLECGTDVGAIRECAICNVVCNSEFVFSTHLAGQKHALLVKRAEAGAGLNTQPVSAST